MVSISEVRARWSEQVSLKGLASYHTFAVAVLGLSAVLYVLLDNDSFFNFWTDRDMVRSVNLLKEFQWMGAELSYGTHARVPGGFLHYIWFIPTIFSNDPDLSYKFCVALAMLSLIPLYQALRDSFSTVTAAVACAVLMASPILFGTLTRLWNPSFQVPFIILSYAFLVRLVAGGDTRAFKWIIACLVLANQMHISAWLLLLAIVLTLVIARIRIPLKEIGWSLVILVVLFSTYFIGEMSTGWWNTKALFTSQGRGALREVDWSSGFTINYENTRDMVNWFSLSATMTDNIPPAPFTSLMSWIRNLALVLGAAYVVLMLAHWLEWGKPITKALGVRTDAAARRTLLAGAVPVVLAVIYYTYSPQIELIVFGSARYLMFAIPGLAIIAGLGAGALVDAAGRSQVAKGAAMGIAGVAMVAPLLGLVSSLRALDKPEDDRGREFIGHMEVVRQQMNWSLAQTVASTTLFKTRNEAKDSWAFEAAFAIGYELHRTGTPLPFAVEGPCIIYIPEGIDIYGEKGITVGVIERSLVQPHAKYSIEKQTAVGKDLMVVYRREGGRCPVGTTNRYVLSPEEDLMFARWGRLPVGKAEPVTQHVKAGESAFMLNLDNLTYTIVKLRPEGGRLVAELHSNQLRGDTYNGGFLEIAMIEAPKLTLTGSDGKKHVVEIEKGLVGGRGAYTPIRTTSQVPPGTYDIEFSADVFPPPPLGTWPIDLSKRRPVKIPVAAGHRIGG